MAGKTAPAGMAVRQEAMAPGKETVREAETDPAEAAKEMALTEAADRAAMEKAVKEVAPAGMAEPATEQEADGELATAIRPMIMSVSLEIRQRIPL